SPRERNYHQFYDHPHLAFDAPEGRREIKEQINRVLARGGLAYELNKEGEIEHLASPAIEEQLSAELPSTGDKKFDRLLQSAIEKFRSPDINVRREALAPLWGAFERSKTMLNSDKKKGAKALVRAATDGVDPREASLLVAEMEQLTKVGNEFRIRH